MSSLPNAKRRWGRKDGGKTPREHLRETLFEIRRAALPRRKKAVTGMNPHIRSETQAAAIG
jgi:hypothetical protein